MTDPRARCRAFLLILVAGLLTGCAREEPAIGISLGSETSLPVSGNQLIALARPPVLAAMDEETLALARLNAARTRWDDLYSRVDARPVGVEALPFLFRTFEGQKFLSAEGNRAIARGAPAETCPATVATTGPEGGSLEELVGQALSRCLDELGPLYPDCGCRVLAVNDYLTVPREEMSYASGTTARMRVPALGLDDVLVADKDEDGILIRDLRGPLARVTRLPGNRARVEFLREPGIFEGRRIPVGYRRGRIAERIYATDAAGARMSLLIGFSPGELAEGAAAWLAWPVES